MKKYILIGAGGLLIIAITLLTKIVHVTDEERLLSLQEQHNKTQKRIEKIYENADKQAKPYVQERDNIEQKAQELRNELFAKEVEYKQAEPIIEDMFTWVEGLYGVPYVLGGKSKEGIDCSGLFTLFGVERGIVSEGYKIHVGNAYNLFNKKTAPVQHPERGNIVFMQPQGGGVNHIAMIHHVAYDFENEMGIVVVDASYGNGVQKRNLVIKKDYGLGSFYRYSIDGKDYTVHFATNPILSFEREEALSTPKEEITANDVIPGNTQDWFYLSHYNVGDIRQNDDSPCHGATGANICEILEGGDRTIALVRPYREKYGIEYWDRVVLEGDESCRGEFIVLDEMNKRFRDRCIVGSNSPYCIRGDIAYPYGEKGKGGNCYIQKVIKQA